MSPRLGLWLVLAGFVIVLDQVTKAWIMTTLAVGDRVTVTSFFNIVYVFNPGASFSFLADAGGWQRWMFVGLALVISLWLVKMLAQHAREKLLPAALALILGGALGNVIDRIRFGAVVDFIQVHAAGWYFPAFNVADSAITVGVALMLWHQFTTKEPANA
jgi:signal peptidase II